MIPVDSALLRILNELLGRELGRNPYGEPVFVWKWGPDMFWPNHATGRQIAVTKKVKIPILGGGGEAQEYEITELTPEYRRDRQTREDKWLISKWLGPEELISGGSGGLGRGYVPGAKPSHEKLAEAWDARFKGAAFPSHGWRIPTSATLPRSPDSDMAPNLADTEWFIACIKQQTAPTAQNHVLGIESSMEKRDEAGAAQIGEEARETWPAFLNINPGARGNDISVPFTKFDRSR
jgi:hypothetical protein